MEKTQTGQNVKWKNIEWDKMLNGKTPNGTKCRMKKRRMGQNVEQLGMLKVSNVESEDI